MCVVGTQRISISRMMSHSTAESSLPYFFTSRCTLRMTSKSTTTIWYITAAYSDGRTLTKLWMRLLIRCELHDAMPMKKTAPRNKLPLSLCFGSSRVL